MNTHQFVTDPNSDPSALNCDECGKPATQHTTTTADVLRHFLTDGSQVYDVRVSDGLNSIDINALSEAHAIKCASEIRQAIYAATGIWP